MITAIKHFGKKTAINIVLILLFQFLGAYFENQITDDYH